MILRRYHGPVGGLLSSKKYPNSNPSNPQADNYEDRGFLNMAISHLQNHQINGNDKRIQENTSSTVITNAEINPPRADETSAEKIMNTDVPGNRRR